MSQDKTTLKRSSFSTLKTSGSSGRGRTVNVEVRKKRGSVKAAAKKATEAAEAVKEATEAAAEAIAAKSVDDAERKRQEAAAKRQAEKEERAKAAKEAKAKKEAEKQEKLNKATKAKKADEAEDAKKATKKATKAKKTEKADKQEAEKPTKAKKDQEAAPAEAAASEGKPSGRKDKRDRHDLDTEDLQQKKSKHGNRKRRVEELMGEDLLDLEEIDQPTEQPAEADEAATTTPLSLSSPRPKRVAKPTKQHTFKAPTEEIKREVELADSITIQQLSQRMSVKATDVIKTLANLGVMTTINQSIDQDTASLVVEEFGHTVKLIEADELETQLQAQLTYTDKPVTRAPVVTVMGHVDHGKTSLLDYIRNSQVASGEAGGITQHIGAYKVSTAQGDICFIDTPGHAAFSAMRARGATSTDIVILVVAADDGVMPQTEEAIQHAKSANVPVVVAVNKMDKEGADPEKIKNELAAKDVIPDDWGGDTQFVQVSAATGKGIEELLEAVLLQAELLELTAEQEGPAQGLVIESELDKNRGPVTTLLVQRGKLKRGDLVVAGQQFGKARVLNDENGQQVTEAGPATPVAVLGLGGTPDAGDSFLVAPDERSAREITDFRRNKAKEVRLTTTTSLDNLFEQFGAETTKALNVVVKADVRGSLEAIVAALGELGNDEVKVNVVLQGVGGISESDANYAVTSGAVIFGFNVRADTAAKKVIEAEGLDLRYYNVIYDLVDDVKAALLGLLDPEIREEIVGVAEVRDVFQSRKLGQIAGCMVMEGTVSKLKKIRVLRDSVVIYEGELESLRHFKDEVEKVSRGTECGIGVKNYNDVKVGDQIEVFDTREIARSL